MTGRRSPRGRWVVLLPACALACTREAEIREEFPPLIGFQPTVPLPDGGVPRVESVTLTGDDAAACLGRETGACTGINDFPCAGEPWLESVAADCRAQSGCRAGGWVSITFGPHGCVTEIGMVEPEAAFVECLTGVVEQYSCPCTDVTMNHFIGVAGSPCGEGGE